jgi:hypothetical protein
LIVNKSATAKGMKMEMILVHSLSLDAKYLFEELIMV